MQSNFVHIKKGGSDAVDRSTITKGAPNNIQKKKSTLVLMHNSETDTNPQSMNLSHLVLQLHTSTGQNILLTN